MDIEITIKYRVKSVFDDNDLKDYFGKGTNCTLKQIIEDTIDCCGLSDFVNNAEYSICDIKKIE